jgi:hypothetical protein
MTAYTFIQCISWDEELRELSGGTPDPSLEPGVFTDGAPLTVPVNQPLIWPLAPGKGKMPVFFADPALVVHRDFAAVLRERGVDNVDYYDVILVDPQTGQRWNDYLIANVVGVVDVIDLGKSQIDPESPPVTAVLFDEIVLDEGRARNLMLFRPRHKQSSLLVSPQLRRALEAKRFPDVEFVEPEDYA